MVKIFRLKTYHPDIPLQRTFTAMGYEQDALISSEEALGNLIRLVIALGYNIQINHPKESKPVGDIYICRNTETFKPR